MIKTKYFQNCLGVFQGGGVKAIAYAGAYEEAINRSVFFSELIGASAGSIVAVLVGAGASPQKLNSILEKVDFQKFLRPPLLVENIKVPFLARVPTRKKWETFNQLKTFSRYLGLYDGSYIREWINENLKELLNINHNPKFSDLYVPTTVIATNIKTKKPQLWSAYTSPDFEVAIAVQNSCLMPFLFQPYDNTYVDGGMLSNLPSYALKPETIFDKILAFGFDNDEDSIPFESCKDYLYSLANTVVDGAVDIQLELQENIYTILINTLGVKSTDFKKLDKNLVKKLVEQGRIAAKSFFDKEHTIEFQTRKREDVAVDIFESFNLLLRSMYDNPTEILLSDDNPTWMYSLFPLLIKWNRDRANVKVLLKRNGESQDHRDYKIRLMHSLGFNVKEVDILPFRGFIIDGYLPGGKAIILANVDKKGVHSTFLEGRFHSEIINLIRAQFNSVHDVTEIKVRSFTIQKTNELITHFRQVWQYSDANISIEVQEIEISHLLFLTKWIKGYKYRQAEEIFKLYKQNNIDLFEPVTLNFETGKLSLVTPPVIEIHNSKLFVIEGNARLLYAYKNNIHKVKSIIINNVSQNLPSTGQYSIKQLLISDKFKSGGDRYEHFQKELFRKIEQTIHDPINSLL